MIIHVLKENTRLTFLEFDFKSASKGKVHGIGFDTDQSADSASTFKLYGTQSYGLTDFDDYAPSAPEWKHYTIPVGQYQSGQQLYLFFANDHDVATPTAESYFSNVTISGSTQTPNDTPTPTATATLTFTPTLTYTPTATFTPTSTPTITPTNTFVPGTPHTNGNGTCWLSGGAWNTYTVYYDIETGYFPTEITQAEWIASIEAAAQTWNNVTPSGFTFVRQVGNGNTVRYEIPDDDTNLAESKRTSTGVITEGYTKINPFYLWDANNTPDPNNPGYYSSSVTYNLQNVTTHEFGHWLFLDDIQDSNCTHVTMDYSIGIGELIKIDLDIADKNAINWQYP